MAGINNLNWHGRRAKFRAAKFVRLSHERSGPDYYRIWIAFGKDAMDRMGWRCGDRLLFADADEYFALKKTDDTNGIELAGTKRAASRGKKMAANIRFVRSDLNDSFDDHEVSESDCIIDPDLILIPKRKGMVACR